MNLSLGGSLTLGSDSTFGNTSVFNMTGGTLIATGAFTSNGGYTQNGGTSTFNGTSVFNTVTLGAGNPVIMNLNAATTIAGLTTDSGPNTPVIQGSGDVTVTGASTLNGGDFGLGGVINFTGGVDIRAPLSLGRTMNVAGAGSITGNGGISGSGLLNITGGTFTVQVDSSINTDLTMSGGTFRVDNAAVLTLATSSGSFTANNLDLAGGATISGTDSVHIAGIFDWIDGSYAAGPLTINTGGTMNVSAPAAVLNTMLTNNGTVDVHTGGLLELQQGNAYAGNFDIAGGGVLDLSNGTHVINGALSGGGALKISASSATLDLANNGTVGALQMLDGLLTGSGNLTTTALSTLAGGTLGAGGNANFNGGVDITGPVTINRVTNVAAASTLSGTGAVTGTGAINNSGSFDLQNDGGLALDMSNSGNLIKSAATSTTITNLDNSGVIDIQSGALVISGSYTQSAGNLMGASDVTVSGLTTLSGGTLNAGGDFNANGGLDITGFVITDRTLNVTGGSMAGTAALSGSGAFNLVGGTFTVGGSNFIDPVITIQAGTFDVLAGGILNDIGSPTTINNNPGGVLNIDGEVFADVFNDGTLSGIGIINGNVTNGGDFNPGNSPGKFTIIGDLELLSSSNLNMEIAGLDPGQYDVLDVQGNVLLGGKMNIIVDTSSGYSGQLNDSFTPIKWVSNSGGSLAVVSATPGYSFDFTIDANGFSIVTVSIPGIEGGVGDLPSIEVLVFTENLKTIYDPFASSSFDEEDEEEKGQTLVCS